MHLLYVCCNKTSISDGMKHGGQRLRRSSAPLKGLVSKSYPSGSICHTNKLEQERLDRARLAVFYWSGEHSCETENIYESDSRVNPSLPFLPLLDILGTFYTADCL